MNGFFSGVFLIALVVFGALYFTSTAVLVSETETDFLKPPFVPRFRYECTYFTGIRVIYEGTDAKFGCARTIKIGEPPAGTVKP